MTPLTARSLLVGAAIVLVVFGVVAPAQGPARVALLSAGACCAALDVLLVRSLRSEPAGRFVTKTGLGVAVGTGSEEVLRIGPERGPTPPIPLGTATHGRSVDISPLRHPHIVVVGAGVLAAAVFRALAEQVRELAVPTGAEIRVASAPELRPIAVNGTEPCPALPFGTAVIAAHPNGAAHPGGAQPTTVVLVAGPALMPRRWDVAIEVGRYGCRVRRPGDVRGTPVSPPLPRLDP